MCRLWKDLCEEGWRRDGGLSEALPRFHLTATPGCWFANHPGVLAKWRLSSGSEVVTVFPCAQAFVRRGPQFYLDLPLRTAFVTRLNQAVVLVAWMGYAPIVVVIS